MSLSRTENQVNFGLRCCESKARVKDSFNHQLLPWERDHQGGTAEMNCKCYR